MSTSQSSGTSESPGGSPSTGSMPNNGTQTANGSTSSDGQNAGTPNGQTSTGQTSPDLTAILARIDAQDKLITKQNKENQSLRSRMKSAIAGDDGTEGTGNETGKPAGVSAEVTESINKLKMGRVKDQLAIEASKALAHNPQDVYKFVEDLAEIADDEGNVKNATKIVADIKKNYPYLFKPPVDGSGDGGTGGPTAKPGDMNSIIRGGFQKLRGGN